MHEDNELVARTGPGTPCGELMRRYWQPAALSEELPAGGAPLPIRLLGEDLVLFRDPSTGSGQAGRPGLLGLHCSHRRADLSFGRVEDGGLRCLYHGWLYDIHGRCLDQPAEPAFRWTDSGGRDSVESSGLQAQAQGGAFREKIRHTAYPCVERAGAIFAYLGPGEPPQFPNYEFLLPRPPENVTVTKYYHECNYHQGNEGNYDLGHLNFLHYRQGHDETGQGVKSGAPLHHRGLQPAVLSTPVALTPYGVRSGKIRGAPDFEGQLLTRAEFILPNFTAFIEGRVTDVREHPGYSVNWHVPIDDTHHWKYAWKFSRWGPLQPSTWASQLGAERGGLTEMVDYRPVRNSSNRFLQDREEMANQTYSGLGWDFQLQDKWAVEGQEPILDWTEEHLGALDVAIRTVRRVLLKAIRDLQEGQEPANVVRNPDRNHFPIVPFVVHVPKGTDWEEFCQDVEKLAGPTGEWSRISGVSEGAATVP